jgi:integrase/recombinase XerD
VTLYATPGRPRLKLSSLQEARRPRRPGHRKTPVEKLGLKAMEPPGSLRAVMAAHLEAMQVANYSESSLLSRASDFRRFAEWCEARGLHRPADVTRPLVERYQKNLYTHRKKNGAPMSVEHQ